MRPMTKTTCTPPLPLQTSEEGANNSKEEGRENNAKEEGLSMLLSIGVISEDCDDDAVAVAVEEGRVKSGRSISPRLSSLEGNSQSPEGGKVDQGGTQMPRLRRHSVADLIRASLPGSYAIDGPGCDRSCSSNGTASTPEPTSVSAQTQSNDGGGEDHLVEATLVADEQDASEVIQADAKVVLCPWLSTRGALFGVLALVLAVIGMAIVVISSSHKGKIHDSNSLLDDHVAISTKPPLLAPNPGDPSNDTPTAHLSTLERIRKNGVLKCGTGGDLQKFFRYIEGLVKKRRNETNASIPALDLSNDLAENFCRALAAAILGPIDAAIELVYTYENNKYEMLANHSIDLLFQRNSMSMEGDVYLEEVGQGLSYSIPYLYNGISFVGEPFYVTECTDQKNNGIQTQGNCSKLRICIMEESNFVEELQVRVPRQNLLTANTTNANMNNFMKGSCNAFATQGGSILAALFHAMGYDRGELVVGSKRFTSVMNSIHTLDSDVEFSDFVNAILMAMLAAEHEGITNQTATLETIGDTNLFGEDYKYMFLYAIQKGGNFGQVYSFPAPRNGRNLWNNGSYGLLASPPLQLGEIQHKLAHQNSIPGGMIETIQSRGTLRCGIRGGRPGFATSDRPTSNASTNHWVGMDIDMCLAVGASLFGSSNEQNVLFYDIATTNATGYELLNAGEIDVLAGAVWTLENDVREPATQVGYSFSQPYFYGPIDDPASSTKFDENLCLASRQDDSRWSAFVYWVLQSLVYAEEHGITARSNWEDEMPLVEVFGSSPQMRRIFRDAVHQVGNYGEIYNRNVQQILPRDGSGDGGGFRRNMLNKLEDNSPLRYIPPGFSFPLSS